MSLRGGLRAFRRDRRGVSAVEFALIAPLLILIYFGLAELSQGMMAKRRVSHTASAIGDLIAQTAKPIDNAEMGNILSVANTLMAPYSPTDLKLRVTSVTGDAQGTAKVDWSEVRGGLTAYQKDQNMPGLPTGLITKAGETAVVSEAEYTYTPLVGYVLKNGLNFREKFYLKPRIVAKVERVP